MTEKLLQFIWQFGYFNKTDLLTSEGESIRLISCGQLNKDQGPDFLNAKIQIGDTAFFGSIELHLQTSDWDKHKHEADKHYSNVILHVVFQHDKELKNRIPVLELEPRISSVLLDRYAVLMNKDVGIACRHSIGQIKEITWLSWKERLLAERLTRKAGHVLQLLEQSKLHWEETFWWMLAKNFGSKLNAEAFEAIAKSIPVNLLAKHKSSIHQLEALLLGQAGLLEDEFEEDYPKLLQREYSFLKKKYKLVPSPVAVVFLRMRPQNFPTVRLAQLAMLIQGATHLFSKTLETESLVELKSWFAITANDFWHYHYTLHDASSFKKKTIGSDAISHLIINAVVPVLFAYGIQHKEEKYKDKALKWLEALLPETNSITKEFAGYGVTNNSAYDSQALIELKNEYCNHKYCLDCAIGNNLLREAVAEYEGAGSKQ